MKIAFCLPGDNFSKNFMHSWGQLLQMMDRWILEEKRDFAYGVHLRYQADMYQVRNGLVIQPGEPTWVELDKLVPLAYPGGGQYDYSMWIDSDMVFTPEDFITLYETAMNAKVDMLTGFYMLQSVDPKCSVVGFLGDEGTSNIRWDSIAEHPVDKNGLIPVDSSGFGFVLIKTEVFDHMTYPYFLSAPTTRGNIRTFPTSDIYFFKRAKKHGFQLYAHPKVILGHEKKMVLT